MNFTDNEHRFCEEITRKDRELRAFLGHHDLLLPCEPVAWHKYLSAIKLIQGNLNNSLSFVATLLAKEFLRERFDVEDFDAAGKPQGASGHDIDVRTRGGDRIVGEIKTVFPHTFRTFGAAQKRVREGHCETSTSPRRAEVPVCQRGANFRHSDGARVLDQDSWIDRG